MLKIATSMLLAASLASTSAVATPRMQDAQAQPNENKSEAPEQGAPQAAAHQDAPANEEKLVLQDGTPVRLRFMRAVISSQVIAGETINLQAVEEVQVGGLAAIALYAPAKATVTMAQAKRSMGRGGNLEMKIESVSLASGESVPLRAIKDVKGGGNKGEMTAGLVAAGLLFWPAAPFAFFVQGKNATIPEGTELTAYINGDISLDRNKFPIAGVAPHGAQEDAAAKKRSEPK